MNYTVHLVGSEKKLKIAAESHDEAVAAFRRQVALPADGWIVVEGDDDSLKQFPVQPRPPQLERPTPTGNEDVNSPMNVTQHSSDLILRQILEELRGIREQCGKTKWAVRALGLLIAIIMIFGFTIRFR